MPYDNNPYNFIPILWDSPPQRGNPAGHNKFTGKTGKIVCSLTTEGPIFIPSNFPCDQDRQQGHAIMRKFCYRREDGREIKIIPGSSLKGVIRSIAEAAANSCLSKFDGGQLDNSFRACNNLQALCITCRLFGMLNSDNFKGNVNFSDARGINVQEMPLKLIPALMNPKPQHTAFYIRNGRLAGRKFYYHFNPIFQLINNRNRYNKTIKPIDASSQFEFNIDFENLTDEEFKILIYSLVLEDNMRHKIGMGKPVGLGSVKISIEQISFYNTDNFDFEAKSDTEKNNIINEARQAYNGSAANLQALRDILHWPPQNNERRYPDRAWFDANHNTPLGNP